MSVFWRIFSSPDDAVVLEEGGEYPIFIPFSRKEYCPDEASRGERDLKSNQ